ncbi:MAG TPA: alpha/beta hydrolase domain-containing protein [Acidimicrobiia bacterium]|nr:alpha/beta hydrolase domain-containing protein [Acidimicrobiia bacterium]
MRRFASVMLVGAIVAAGCSSSHHTATTLPKGLTPKTGELVAPPASPVARPTVAGPVTGGTPDIPVNAMPTGFAKQYGYSEHEYFFSGTATAYGPKGTWGEDGKWTVAPTTTAAYKSRMVVRVPTDPARFNGTVVLEWFNETAGRDSDPDFGFAHTELLHDGFAYVGVSAQALGITGTGGFTIPIPGYNPVSLKMQNPKRYASLSHPGDDYSYDIFSQAAQAIWRPKGVNPLGTLHPSRLIATGESQSASRMVTYVNAIAPVSKLFQGFMIHSRGNDGEPVNAAAKDSVPDVVHIRGDEPWPVMTVETETDLFGLGFAKARQPDTNRFVTWELAGTSHADQTTLDYGIASGHVWSPGEKAPDFTSLCGVINDGPENYGLDAAFAALNLWVTNHVQPPHPAPIDTTASTIVRDAVGNARGGVRLPAVVVPISTLDGTLKPGVSVICSLFGSTTPFTPAHLRQIYPTHQRYVLDIGKATQEAKTLHLLTNVDAEAIEAAANAAPIPS